MKRTTFFVLAAAFMAAVLLLDSCISQKSSVPGVTSIRSMPGNEIYRADLDVPQIDGEPLLNTMISDTINTWYDDFVTTAELNSQVASPSGRPYPFNSYWKVTFNNEECVSLVLKSYQYVGGANGMETMATFTWNKLTDQLIPLESLLPLVLEQPDLASLAKICREELTEALAAKSDANLRTMIQSGTEPVPDNYKFFTISDKGLSVYFEKYQVAPGSAGTQAVLIPYLK